MRTAVNSLKIKSYLHEKKGVILSRSQKFLFVEKDKAPVLIVSALGMCGSVLHKTDKCKCPCQIGNCFT